VNARGTVTLKMLERADKEILKLSRTEKGAVLEFQQKFRQNPDNPGLHLKPLSGDSRLWSARVTQDYRALLLRVSPQEYLLVSVRHRKDVYDNLDRYSYQINRVSGGIEVIDLGAIGDSIVGRVLPPDPEAGRKLEDTEPQRPSPDPVPERDLFADVTDQQLRDLGVAETLLPLIRRITNEEQLLCLTEYAPQLSTEVLLALYDGKTFEEVLEFVTRPVAADDDVDPTDYAAAANRPATQVTSDDAALQAILAESFARWQVFLHPTQRKIVDRTYTGSARVGGGPGTGKTIVALHRVKHLAEHLPPGDDTPILLTTFNRNLAEDLRARLKAFCEPELVARVEILNIDKLASRVVAEAAGGQRRRIIDDNVALNKWRDMMFESPGAVWDADFLAAEWSEVIVGQAVESRTEYFRARRAGRGRPLSRQQRAEIWQLAEKFTQRLDEEGVWTWGQVAEQAARRERDRAARTEEALANGASSGGFQPYRYRHIVVDEAQDLRPAHWRMLRAMVPPGENDIFVAGDTHQRIYGHYVTLGSLGINIRGRSARLTLNYRTTQEILRSALGLLTGEVYDDLDGDTDTLNGYRSVLRGEPPRFQGAQDAAAEEDLVVAQFRAWGAPSDGSVAIAVPTSALVDRILARLNAEGIEAAEIGPDGAKGRGGVHVGTMHRFKGLEYQRMILAGVSDGLVPRGAIAALQDRDSRAYQRERLKDRSLLFVAATRARDDLAVFWHGAPSPFLPSTAVGARA
jgi:superfamily I DNA/RNA helicase/mRNA-degrading endonuclease RelE of RelBE toxin-antitoxin system